MTLSRVRLRWARREPPLPPAAVAASGDAGRRLRAAVRACLGRGAELRAAAGDDWIVALGDRADLPWVDGASYLGWDAGLLVPTTLVPWPAAELVRESPAAGEELVVLLPDRVLISAMPRRRADPAVLAADPGDRS
jgi:hypothetical protein